MAIATEIHFSEAEIITKVVEVAGEIVEMEPSEISVDSSVYDDLEMESIDFIDIVFRLEKAFGIEIPRINPIQSIVAALGEGKFIQEGKLTPKGLKLLKLAFPNTSDSRIDEAVQDGEIYSLMTIQTYVNVVKRGLEIAQWQPEKCGACGETDIVAADKEKLEFPDVVPMGPVFLCRGCNNMLIAPSFDEPLFKQISIL